MPSSRLQKKRSSLALHRAEKAEITPLKKSACGESSSESDDDALALQVKRSSTISFRRSETRATVGEGSGSCPWLCSTGVPWHYQAEVKADPRIRVILVLLLFLYPPLVALVDAGVSRALRHQAHASENHEVEMWQHFDQFYCEQGEYSALADTENNCFLDDGMCKYRCRKNDQCVAAFRTWVSYLDMNKCRGKWICTMLPACTLVPSKNPNDRVFVKKNKVAPPMQPDHPDTWASNCKRLATSAPWIHYFVPMFHVTIILLVVCFQGCAGIGFVSDALLVCLPSFIVLAYQRVEAAFQSQCWVQLLGLLLIGILYIDFKIKECDVHQRIDNMPLRQYAVEQELLDHVRWQGINLDSRATREGMTAILGGLVLTALICGLIYYFYQQIGGSGVDESDGSLASLGEDIHSFFTHALVGCDPTRIIAFVGACVLFYILSGFLQLGLTHMCRGARICASIAPADELRMHAYKTAAEAFAAEQKALVYVSMLDKSPGSIQAWVGNREPTVLMLKQLVVMHGGQQGIQEFVQVHTDQRAKQVLEQKIEGEFNPSQKNQWCAIHQDAEAVDAAFRDTLAKGGGVAAGVHRAAAGAFDVAARIGASAALGPAAGCMMPGARPSTMPSLPGARR